MGTRRPVERGVLAVLVAVLALAVAPVTGAAQTPPPPPNPSGEELEAGQDGAAAAAREVGALANRVAEAGAALDAAQAELARTYEAATQAMRERDAARAVADAAQAVADSTRAQAQTAGVEVREAQRQLDTFVAASYRQGSLVGSVAGFLGADDPEDLLARAEFLGAVGSARLDALEDLRRARIDKVNQDSAARAALAEARERERAAAAAKVASDTAYDTAVAAEAAAERRNAELLARKAELERELDVAQRVLAELEGRRRTYEEWQQARRAAEAAAEAASAEPPASPSPVVGAPGPSGVAAPTSGTITSTFGPRWGSIHYGLDIANSIGTPIVSAMDGRVISAGPASGFGLWVRVRHDDGTITVYGHINEYLVSVGERVEVGEQIATIGNRGQSTGPHLHFEVVRNGSKVDPLVWLRGEGVSI